MDPHLDRPDNGCEAMPSEHESDFTSSCGAYDRLFEVGIAHLHRYVSVHGSARPPGGATIDGFLIAS